MVAISSKIRSKKWLFYPLVTIIALVIIFFILVFYVDQRLANRLDYSGYDHCAKIWSTRGLVPSGQIAAKWGNSIETIQRAFDSGAKGTEVDLFFDPAKNRFIISHDRPYNLKNGQLLTLETLLNSTSKGHYFWLDFKKLSRLNQTEVKAAVVRLSEITTQHNLKKYIYVEGEHPINLGYFRDAGFNTIFDTQPLPEKSGATYFVINVYKMFYYFSDFTVMAMKSGDHDAVIFGPKTSKLLTNVPLFIYHTETAEASLNHLLSFKQVKVIIERDHSSNHFNLNHCDDSIVNSVD